VRADIPLGSSRADSFRADLPLAELRAALLDWYAKHRRELPWRAEAGETPDPYAVWVSEIMLQQTQVATVGPYFERWMQRFPDVEALAAAEVNQVLALWQGLGYYSRARNLHAAARVVLSDHGSRLPTDPIALRALPGIGEYSAGAIAAIAFGIPAPAVDGNVRRVLARLDAVEGDTTRGAARKHIRALATRLTEGPKPGDLVQALMELGASLCRPRRPDCPACPLAGACRARAQGRQEMLPAVTPRARQRREHVFAFVLAHPVSGQWLLARRHAEGLLGGLWEFPMIGARPGADPVDLLQETFGLAMSEARRLPVVTHVFSHIRLTVTPVLGRADGGRPMDEADAYADWCRAQPVDLHGEALPSSTLMDKLVASAEAAGPGAAGEAVRDSF